MNKTALSAIFAFLFVSASAFLVFQMKYKVQNLSKDLQGVEAQIALEKDAIHVLKAEWTYLNHPDRLRVLANNYLNMQNMTVAQMRSAGDRGAFQLASYKSVTTIPVKRIVPKLKRSSAE